ncbi:sigma-70 family RNA polymerase sigma factor [Fimbriiglobus ruber]|uniref:High-affnity carbon uptake protein Hat/HatR n=1 Tax=Fimbriiglobus ruber TaxID=1908690 RepID=A0A225D3C3_9BACT|nr:sigma-70 family RNA polymerase sigma factor [Fimbriiglobus ruber]OWK36090.1 High-affnity carbon uptake protein Hat/HatR [Fimbriiglobus ruber]
MATHRTAGVFRALELTTRAAGVDDAPTAALLAWFAADRNQAAFAELVRRHGPLVLGVCRRVAGHREDAEDAFQATFLILAAKAGRISHPDRLPAWLYGVAYRIARRARRAAARRRAREVQVMTLPDPPANPTPEAADWGPVLDDELAALPDRYRAAIVICDLEQAARAEAARALGIPEGTLSSRLAAGRKKLGDRLARRGVTLTVAGLGSASVSSELAARTAAAAGVWVSGGVGISGPVAALARGGVTTMRTTVMVIAAVAALAAGTVAVVARAPADPPRDPVKKAEPPPAPVAEAKKAEPVEEKFVYGQPRRRGKFFDLRGSADKLFWNSDGSRLAVWSRTAIKKAGLIGGHDIDLPENAGVIQIISREDEQLVRVIPLQSGQIPLGFMPGGEQFVTQTLDRPDAINASNRLEMWGEPPPGGFGLPREWPLLHRLEPDERKSRDLNPEAGRRAQLIDDPKKAWVDFHAVGSDGQEKFGLRGLNLVTGESGRPVVEAPVKFWYWGVSPDGRTAVTVHVTDTKIQPVISGSPRVGGTICGWDLTTGRELWRETSPLRTDSGWWAPQENDPVFSRDGRYVLTVIAAKAPERPKQEQVFGSGGLLAEFEYHLRVFDARTGKEISRKLLGDECEWGAISADGRLLACALAVPKQGVTRKEQKLRIVALDTGVVVKNWNAGPSALAFAPRTAKGVRSQILAIAEQRTDDMRIGLWEFRLEAQEP